MSLTLYSQSKNNEPFTSAIEDNSMFIEEAYNQENGVVQHISNFAFLPNLKDNCLYTFTQEWPAFGLKHQLSYTLPYTIGGASGMGDILINYRYQMSYKENFITYSPRVSIIIPSGNKNKELGSGTWGLQANMPLSKRWTSHFINHVNAGVTYYNNVKQDSMNFNKSLVSYFVGASSIWLITEKFNLMLECLTNFYATPALNNKVRYSRETILAPAFRYAIDIKKLQIIPGISVPFTFNQNHVIEVGGFFYLSIEHEF